MYMYNTLLRLYRNTGNKILLENAVKKGWITEEEMEEIIKTVDGE